MAELCREFDISRKTGYEISQRYKNLWLEATRLHRRCAPRPARRRPAKSRSAYRARSTAFGAVASVEAHPANEEAFMAKMTDRYLANNRKYAGGEALHRAAHPGKQPINPAKHVAVLACMDARIDVEDLLGLQTGDAHIIRNAGGVVNDDAIRCLIISHHLLDTNEIILIHHTRCGMLAFTDDLLKAGLEGDPAAEKLLGQATHRAFKSCEKCASTPSQFHAFRGAIEPLDAEPSAKQIERLQWDVRRSMSSILNHPWIPTSGPDAVAVRGFIYDVDTGKLDEVSYPGPMGSIS
jgi:carbonic anhydrase